jgi:hypothetical protein
VRTLWFSLTQNTTSTFTAALKIKLVGKGEAHWIEKKQKATFFHDTEEYYVNFESSLIEGM